MTMFVGEATVMVVKAKGSGMEVEAYKNELEAVLAMIDGGSLGNGMYWGDEAHEAALDQVVAKIAKMRALKAKLEAEEKV